MVKRVQNGKGVLPRRMRSSVRRFALVMACVIAAVAMPSAAFAEEISGDVKTSVTWNDGDTVAGVTVSGGTEAEPVVITVNGTVTLNGAVTVNGHVRFTGGGTLLRGSASDMISVSGADVSFDNITVDGNNISGSHYALDISGTSNVTVNEGTVICNNVNTGNMGSAIYVGSGAVHITMNGGEIKNNRQKNRGTIYLNGSVIGCTFTMNGGSVTGNACTNTATTYGGGGFYVRSATLTVNGGIISGNSADTDPENPISRGGGIYCSSYGKLVLNGGVITGNEAHTGSGIFFSAQTSTVNAELYIGGDTLISLNNDLYLDNENAVKYPYITSSIKSPLPLVTESYIEDRVLAEGSGYTLTEADMTKVRITSGGTAYYAKLEAESNQILMTNTDPNYIESFYVSYFGNGGTGSVSDSKAYGENEQATVMNNGFTRTGYVFTGFGTAADGSGTVYQPGDPITVSTDVELYALWRGEQYAVTYNGNGGTGTMADGTATNGVAFTLPACGFTAPAGKRFKEWAIGSVSGTKAAANSTHVFTAAATLYAIWEDIPTVTYAVTFDSDGGSAVAPITAAQGETIAAPQAPAKENHTFAGWFKEAARTDPWAFATDTVSGNMTLYAKWTLNEPVQYRITRGQNGTWTEESTDGLGFTANGMLDKFAGVSVDGSAVSGDDYTVQSGSTVVMLNAAYLETLAVGQHTLWVSFTDGYAETAFTVFGQADIPATGDSATPILWLGIMLAACAGLAASVIIRRRRRNG